MSCFTACWSPFLSMKVQVSGNAAVETVPCTHGTSAIDTVLEASGGFRRFRQEQYWSCLHQPFGKLEYLESTFMVHFPLLCFFSLEGQCLQNDVLRTERKGSERTFARTSTPKLGIVTFGRYRDSWFFLGKSPCKSLILNCKPNTPTPPSFVGISWHCIHPPLF